MTVTSATSPSSITGASSASSSSSSSSTSSAQAAFGTNYSDFLTLLTAQLQNQDPTAPTDSAQFTNQLVLFSGVEQQINTNSQLTTLNATAQQQLAATSALDIGTTATGSGNSFTLGSNGTATISYTLPTAAQTAYVAIQDSTGTTVQTLTGGTAAGSNSVTWNGLNYSGTAEPAGTYTMKITATGASNAAITATSTTSGTVTGVSNSNGTTYLDIGSLTMPLSGVTSISSPTSSSSTTGN